ncbi:MAG: hypothetical protein ACK5BV_03375 [Bacteroidota bacterium]|jgi:predicted RND superfamily exporter protein
MKITLLQKLADTTKTIVNSGAPAIPTNNHWKWIAIGEFVLLCILIFIYFNSKKVRLENTETDLLDQAKGTTVDMDALMKNINESKPLYDKLKVKCHPDKFHDDEEKRKVADDLFQEITQNKRNYSKLLELQELAKQKLNITI